MRTTAHIAPACCPGCPTACPRYIRYIYNRIILENATVRAAAVSALANFGARCKGVRDRVVVLLKRALYDNDDEVRGPDAQHLQRKQRRVHLCQWEFVGGGGVGNGCHTVHGAQRLRA